MAKPITPGSEQGAETIQLAIAVPIIFILAMGVVQLCLMAFYTLTLSNEADQAAWEVDLDSLHEASGSSSANDLVKETILDRSVAIAGESLTVENARYDISAEYSQQWENSVPDKIAYSDDHKSRYFLGTIYHDSAAGLVEFDVSYTLPSIINLPGLSGVTVKRHVCRERILWSRTEVG